MPSATPLNPNLDAVERSSHAKRLMCLAINFAAVTAALLDEVRAMAFLAFSSLPSGESLRMSSCVIHSCSTKRSLGDDAFAIAMASC